MNISSQLRKQKRVDRPTSVNLPLPEEDLEKVDRVRGAISRRQWLALAAKHYLETQEVLDDESDRTTESYASN